jgi:hypothetical protein
MQTDYTIRLTEAAGFISATMNWGSNSQTRFESPEAFLRWLTEGGGHALGRGRSTLNTTGEDLARIIQAAMDENLRAGEVKV